MTTPTNYRRRKATNVIRDHALFELMEDETPLLDIGFNDGGIFEVAFNLSMAGKVMEVEQLLGLLDQGKVLATRDQQT